MWRQVAGHDTSFERVPNIVDRNGLENVKPANAAMKSGHVAPFLDNMACRWLALIRRYGASPKRHSMVDHRSTKVRPYSNGRIDVARVRRVG